MTRNNVEDTNMMPFIKRYHVAMETLALHANTIIQSNSGPTLLLLDYERSYCAYNRYLLTMGIIRVHQYTYFLLDPK